MSDRAPSHREHLAAHVLVPHVRELLEAQVLLERQRLLLVGARRHDQSLGAGGGYSANSTEVFTAKEGLVRLTASTACPTRHDLGPGCLTR